MKVKVIKRFNDKTADFITRVPGKGEDILDVSDERAKELIAKGFVEKVEESEAELKQKNTKSKKTN